MTSNPHARGAARWSRRVSRPVVIAWLWAFTKPVGYKRHSRPPNTSHSRHSVRMASNCGWCQLIRVQAEQRVQRVDLHLALGGSVELQPQTSTASPASGPAGSEQ
jgi:hypothetical protein